MTPVRRLIQTVMPHPVQELVVEQIRELVQ